METKNFNRIAVLIVRGVARCELTLNPEMQKLLIECFDLENEVMSGATQTFPDGRKRFVFTCPIEKAMRLSQFATRCGLSNFQPSLN